METSPCQITVSRCYGSISFIVIDVLNSSLAVDGGKTLVNAEELDPPVQGPINREPDEKLFPERYVQRESGIRKL